MRRLLAVLLALVSAVGCTHGGSSPRAASPVPTPSFSEGPRPVPPPQTGWMHGVGVDVPTTWPRNQLRCGEPWRTTLVVQSAGAAVPLCLWLAPKNFHPDVVWIGGYVPSLTEHTVLGTVEVPAGGLKAMRRLTIAGEPAAEWRSRDRRTGEPAVLIVLPRRAVFVTVSSVHRTIRDSVVASIRFVPKDPATGCATRSTAYDRPPRHPVFDRPIDVSGAVSVVGCHYIRGWLETTTGPMSGRKLRTLVAAIDAAPPLTTVRAPIDAGCAGLTPGPPEYNDDGPAVLRFIYADGRSTLVVVRVVWCTRWQSYLYAGDVERRLTGAVLLALPPLLSQFPGPDTM
ncbi:MAG: hypothetical protein QOG34_1333 [Frankiaceae bacterium]|nr:hypothetical protein [Frankiaceae bacterium]